jgi:AAA ATPase-like protein
VATRGQALVLRGEPGIGKSRLLSETAQAAGERGMVVLTTAAAQSEAHLPFAGLHQLLRPVRGRAAELPAVQRAVLDAPFGLDHEVAPDHYHHIWRVDLQIADLSTTDRLATRRPAAAATAARQLAALPGHWRGAL